MGSIGHFNQGNNDKAMTLERNSKNLFHYLDDLTINGREANEFSVREMAEIGAERHKILFANMLDDFNNGKFEFDARKMIDY